MLLRVSRITFWLAALAAGVALAIPTVALARAWVRMPNLKLSAQTCHRGGQRGLQGSGMLADGYVNRVLMTLHSDFRAVATGS